MLSNRSRKGPRSLKSLLNKLKMLSSMSLFSEGSINNSSSDE